MRMHIVVHQPGITRLVQLRERHVIEAVLRAIESDHGTPRVERPGAGGAGAHGEAPLRSAAVAELAGNGVDLA